MDPKKFPPLPYFPYPPMMGMPPPMFYLPPSLANTTAYDLPGGAGAYSALVNGGVKKTPALSAEVVASITNKDGESKDKSEVSETINYFLLAQQEGGNGEKSNEKDDGEVELLSSKPGKDGASTKKKPKTRRIGYSRQQWNDRESLLLIYLVKIYGSKWAHITKVLARDYKIKRTVDSVKNRHRKLSLFPEWVQKLSLSLNEVKDLLEEYDSHDPLLNPGPLLIAQQPKFASDSEDEGKRKSAKKPKGKKKKKKRPPSPSFFGAGEIKTNVPLRRSKRVRRELPVLVVPASGTGNGTLPVSKGRFLPARTSTNECCDNEDSETQESETREHEDEINEESKKSEKQSTHVADEKRSDHQQAANNTPVKEATNDAQQGEVE